MEYDIIVRTFDLGRGCFAVVVFEAGTGVPLYLSPSLGAADCASTVLHLDELAHSQGYRAQVRICEGLVGIARQIVASLN